MRPRYRESAVENKNKMRLVWFGLLSFNLVLSLVGGWPAGWESETVSGTRGPARPAGASPAGRGGQPGRAAWRRSSDRTKRTTSGQDQPKCLRSKVHQRLVGISSINHTVLSVPPSDVYGKPLRKKNIHRITTAPQTSKTTTNKIQLLHAEIESQKLKNQDLQYQLDRMFLNQINNQSISAKLTRECSFS